MPPFFYFTRYLALAVFIASVTDFQGNYVAPSYVSPPPLTLNPELFPNFSTLRHLSRAPKTFGNIATKAGSQN